MLISKEHLRAQHTVSKDMTRPLLTVIDITKSGDQVIAVSTDGYSLLRVVQDTPSSSDFPEHIGQEIDHVRLSAQTAKRLKAALKGNEMLPITDYALVTDEGVITTDLSRTAIFNDQDVEGTYPDYERNMPAGEPIASVTLNPKLLAQVLKGFDGMGSIKLELHGDVKPVVIKAGGEELEVTGVVMPLKA